MSDDEVLVLTRDNPHIWAGDNGGPVEITDEMIKAGADIVTGYLEGCDIYSPSLSRLIAQDTYAAMEAKRREQVDLDAARAAVNRMDARKDENMEEWASKLADDLSKFTD